MPVRHAPAPFSTKRCVHIPHRALRHAEDSLLRLADTKAAGRNMIPREECEDGAGRTGFVAEIEVIGAGIVEVHGLLHQPQAEDARIEIEIALRRTGDGGDVVDTVGVGLGGHEVPPGVGRRFPWRQIHDRNLLTLTE